MKDEETTRIADEIDPEVSQIVDVLIQEVKRIFRNIPMPMCEQVAADFTRWYLHDRNGKGVE